MKYSELKKYIKLAKKYGYESLASDMCHPPKHFDIQCFYSDFIQGNVIINNIYYDVIEGDVTEKKIRI